MDWRIKLAAQKMIAFLPGKTAHRVHTWFQRRMGVLGRLHDEGRRELVERSINLVEFLQAETGFSFDGSRIVEVGTGWIGTDITMFALLGCREMWTCDHMRHLTETDALAMRDSFQCHLDEISQRCRVDRAVLSARFDRLAECRTLDEFLTAAHCRYEAPQLFHRIDFPAAHFDLFYSCSVLQYMPLRHLQACLATAHRALRPGALSLHVLHHYDHNARHQNGLSPLNYLRYSDWAYELMQTRKFNYQNRLRHVEFLQLFEQHGYETIAERLVRTDGKNLEHVPLARRFRNIPEDDVRVTRTQLISRVSDRTP